MVSTRYLGTNREDDSGDLGDDSDDLDYTGDDSDELELWNDFDEIDQDGYWVSNDFTYDGW